GLFVAGNAFHARDPETQFLAQGPPYEGTKQLLHDRRRAEIVGLRRLTQRGGEGGLAGVVGLVRGVIAEQVEQGLTRLVEGSGEDLGIHADAGGTGHGALPAGSKCTSKISNPVQLRWMCSVSCSNHRNHFWSWSSGMKPRRRLCICRP